MTVFDLLLLKLDLCETRIKFERSAMMKAKSYF